MENRPLSASSVKTFLQCLLKYYYRYEEKKPRLAKNNALAFGTAVHEALEELYSWVKEEGAEPTPEVYDRVLRVFTDAATKNGLDDMSLYEEGRTMLISRLDSVDPNDKIVGVELHFELKTANGTPFTGSIDKLFELDEDTVVIVDYKTSRTALTQDEADRDIQLSMYDLAVSMLYPKYKNIICAFDYLRFPEVITHRTSSQRQIFSEFLDSVYKQINTLTKASIKPELNEFCAWCDFKNLCPEYTKAVTDPDLKFLPFGEMDDDAFVEIWEKLGSVKRAVEGAQREIKSEAYSRMKYRDAVSGNSKELYRTQQSRMNYDARAVFNIVGQEEYIRMSSVNKTSVDKFLRDNPEYIRELEDSASFSFNAPAFRTRKLKDENS